MTATGSAKRALEVVEACRVSSAPEIYAIGPFDERVTVLTQQRRALNLAWSLIETNRLQTSPGKKRCRIAVLGGGFAGLTFAAALMSKKCDCTVTLFEERDTLLPLQQGSDTRWLHPHIYDWPAEGSEAVAAMLPVLNWTAARASDVVVQVLSGWSDVVKGPDKPSLTLWCNTRHLQLREARGRRSRLEWVGEQRAAATGGALDVLRDAQGKSQEFDIVVLAVGFGLESSGSSYWRNEILGQPGLEHRRTPYMVSGQGDGALIDLLRLKISQFRQDRILAELFNGREALVGELRKLRQRFDDDKTTPLYDAFHALAGRRRGDPVREQFDAALAALTRRLRRDTEVVLQLKPEVRGIADLLGNGRLKASFQNALLVFMLYRCGGFAPASGSPLEIAERFKVAKTHIIRRHGTQRADQLKRILPDRIYQEIVDAREADETAFLQTAEIQWLGGYFGARGRQDEIANLPDTEKIARKEYMPGPTGLFAASVAGAVAGHLLATRPDTKHLRVTVHRVITIHGEDVLQQACNYVGKGPVDSQPTLGRVFPAANGTIGLAYRTRQIVRSQLGVTGTDLDKAMRNVDLNTASREMAKDVRFVAALPVLQPETNFFAPSPVCAVVYLDSRDEGFDLDEATFAQLTDLVSRALEAARAACENTLDRLENTPLRALATAADASEPLPADVADEMEFVAISPSRLSHPFTLNIDHSDITPIAH